MYRCNSTTQLLVTGMDPLDIGLGYIYHVPEELSFRQFLISTEVRKKWKKVNFFPRK